MPDNPSHIDVCIVCALAEEAKAFIEVVSEYTPTSFEPKISLLHGYDYRFTTIQNIKGELLTLHVSWLPRYGPLQMAVHLSHVLEEYQPRFVAMTGICAGDKNHVALGDLVVAERTFTYDSGKFILSEDGQVAHEHDTTTYQLDENILRFVHLFDQWKPLVKQLNRPSQSKRQQRDWLLNRALDEQPPSVKKIPLPERNLYAPDWQKIVRELQRGPNPLLTASMILKRKSRIAEMRHDKGVFPFVDPPQARCFIKPMASGSAVRSDAPFKDIQVPVRGTVAIDMEGASFCEVMSRFPQMRWLVVKGVSDYADTDKDDTYHNYASRASAAYVLAFLQHYLSEERIAAERNQQQKAIPGQTIIQAKKKGIAVNTMYGNIYQFGSSQSDDE